MDSALPQWCSEQLTQQAASANSCERNIHKVFKQYFLFLGSYLKFLSDCSLMADVST